MSASLFQPGRKIGAANPARQPPRLAVRLPRSGCLAVLLFLLAAPPLPAQEPLLGNTGAHDPSTMIWDGSRYYVFYTGAGIPWKWSTNKVNWNFGGTVFPPNNPPAWTTNAVPSFTGFFWAPDIAWFNGRFHLYYSVSEWGTINSAIGLVTTPSLLHPVWTDQGKVIQSDAVWEAGPDTDVTFLNCIDPGLLVDTNGAVWMVYGSYSDGIYVVGINPATGKRFANSDIGVKVAGNCANFFCNTTEAAALHQRGGFYYLFLNYGGCCSGLESTYNIRVGRGTSPTGPFFDRNGVNLVNSGGTMFLESVGRYVGPGHAGLLEEDGVTWLSYHYYDALHANPGEPTLGLHRVAWTADDWPEVTNHWNAFLPVETDARDHRGQFPGALTNGAVTVADPERGRALDLDGVAAHVRFTPAIANASTFMAWVHWRGGGDWQRIFDFGTNTSRYLFLTPRANNGRMRFAIRNGGGEQTLDAPFALPTNTWCHVAVTLDGQRGTLFFNGQPVATNTAMTLRPWQLLARSNYLGRSQFPADPYFNGRLDSVRVFGRALAAPEIRDLAWAHPALAHRYRFTDGVRDSIGQAHGALHGGARVTNGVLRLNGVPGDYAALPGGLVSFCSAVTFEFWAAFRTNAAWARVFDFGTVSGASGSRYVFYSPRSGSGTQRFQISTTAGTFTHDPPPALDGRAVHVVCVLDPAANFAAVYTNGVLQSQAVAVIPPITGVHTNLAWLGRSLFAADGWLNADLDEFRIYHGRLTPAEIAANFRAGPDALALPVTLQVADLGPQVELSWPAWAVGFQLESAADLVAPAWLPANAAPVLGNGRWITTLGVTNSPGFHRLKR